jgi:hypothetical protein
MSDDPTIEGTVADEGPEPDLAAAVDPLLPVVSDPADQHEVMVRMDEADVQMLLTWAQGAALRRWVYALPGNKGEGLTVHATQDVIQRMNWTGKTKVGLLLDANGKPVLDVEVIEADEGNGLEPFWVATAYARDEVTGAVLPGASMEPQWMKLKDYTAGQKRKEGKVIREDNKVFNRFSRSIAIQKATRNALAAFIPEEIKQTVIAMFVGDPQRVQRIRTEAEVKVAELPPPLDDEEARALIARAEEVYAEIRELGGGRGKIKMTPGTFNAWKLQAQHSHDRLRDFITYLEERREQIPVELQRDDEEREAVESANDVACPACEQPAGRFCKGIRGAHGERVRARLEQIRGAA